MQKIGNSGSNLGVFNTAIYEKIVRCSFKSFEQCSGPSDPGMLSVEVRLHIAEIFATTINITRSIFI